MNGVVAISVGAYLIMLGLAVWITDGCQQEMAAAAIAARKNSTV